MSHLSISEILDSSELTLTEKRVTLEGFAPTGDGYRTHPDVSTSYAKRNGAAASLAEEGRQDRAKQARTVRVRIYSKSHGNQDFVGTDFESLKSRALAAVAAYGLTEGQAYDLIALGRSIHEGAVVKPAEKTFTVIAVSSNANSFGYKQALALADDGEGVALHVQAYGTDKVPLVGEVVRKSEPRWYSPLTEGLRKTTPEKAAAIIADALKQAQG